MKITAIKQQVKNPERVSIFVDGKYEFSLSLDELLKERLKKADELDKSDIKRLKKLSADGKLRLRAMEWLLNRPHSSREFHDYLYRKKVELEQIENLTSEFRDKGYLNDHKFGEWLIDLHKRRGKSDRAIRAELFKKGLDRESVDELLQGGPDDEAERLSALIEKKLKLARYKNDPDKLKQYLARQGFGYNLINEAMRNGGTRA